MRHFILDIENNIDHEMVCGKDIMNVRLARSINTLTQMLNDRGEYAPKLSLLSQADIDDLLEAPVQGVVRIDTGSRDVIFFTHKTKSGDLTRAATDTSEQRLGDAILVTLEPFKKTQRTAAISSFGPAHEAFTLAELSLNISRHVLVPKHELVPADQVESLMAKVMVSRLSQLPVIKPSDAMAKYIRARPGDVVKIVRVCPTAGTQVAFRYCRT